MAGLKREQRQLTEKQLAFVKAYWECKNATEAWHSVYNQKNTNSRSTCAHNAHRMLSDERIIAELDKFKASVSPRATITLEDSIAAQSEVIELARQTGNVAVMAAAAMNRAKLLGHVTDKTEQKVHVTQAPAEVSPDIATLWRKAGLAEVDFPEIAERDSKDVTH